ncbi:MAG TPA: hypothetical protein VKX46_17255, partial [Ktedonobacteraceae bacterium]|nr:hypothetical protein [Ktedonobacteraceae bacterium]
GNIYALSSNGTTYYIGGTIRDKYESLNGPDGILGVPTADMQTITGGWKSTFKNGTIYCQTSSPAYYVKGAILAKYQSLGETTSSLGFPTSDEQTLSWGWENTFQHGTISYNSSTGVTTVQYT